jgi:trk system potassium uptake protein TrkH
VLGVLGRIRVCSAERGTRVVGANLDTFEVWVCTFAMLIGRLELFSVLVLFTPAFWRR